LLNQGRLPVARGLALSRDDLVRRTVIMALMCQGSVLFESVELSHLVDFKQYFAPELKTLETMQDQGLLNLDKSGIHVTELGWFFVRGVAMVFDKYLQVDKNRARFSKII
jgi:oxygen-independent coproporphyrinogen-3 oxidase